MVERITRDRIKETCISKIKLNEVKAQVEQEMQGAYIDVIESHWESLLDKLKFFSIIIRKFSKKKIFIYDFKIIFYYIDILKYFLSINDIIYSVILKISHLIKKYNLL